MSRFLKKQPKKNTEDKKNSSLIKNFVYNNGNLEIEFTSGAKYVYKDVPREVFEEFKNADSLGIYFNRNIKGSKYSFCKL